LSAQPSFGKICVLRKQIGAADEECAIIGPCAFATAKTLIVRAQDKRSYALDRPPGSVGATGIPRLEERAWARLSYFPHPTNGMLAPLTKSRDGLKLSSIRAGNYDKGAH
jgi:hypothetical protein